MSSLSSGAALYYDTELVEELLGGRRLTVPPATVTARRSAHEQDLGLSANGA